MSSKTKRALSAAAAAAALSIPMFAGSASATGIVPPADPPSNIPTALYDGSCYSASVDWECAAQSLFAINAGRASEGLGPMILPAGYLQMSIQEQQWVVTNLERGDRGLPVFAGLDPLANADADAGAAATTDPDFSAITGVGTAGAIWAGSSNPLGSDVLWMYYDGPGGSNFDCMGDDMSGCWGHRNNILGDYVTANNLTPILGVSSAAGPSEAQEFAGLLAPDGQTPVTFPPLTFPINNPAGVVTMSEDFGSIGDRVTIQGVGFLDATEVDFGAVAGTDMTVVDDSTITVTVPAGTGLVGVTVRSPDGDSIEAPGITDFAYA
jgi:IPT/TIG domain